jgi:hypothetical protein
MFPSNPLNWRVRGRCFATITRQAQLKSTLLPRRNSMLLCLQRFRDMWRCGINVSDLLVRPTTRCDSCAMLRKTGWLTWEQNGVPDEFTVAGSEWFRNNNFTALPILLVNPVALYGYGDINIVPAVRHEPTSALHLQGSCMHALTRD